MTSLESAFKLASPRISPRNIPYITRVIHVLLVLASAFVFSRVLVSHNAWAWSAGFAYVTYDTLLLAFVASQTLGLLKPAALIQNTQAKNIPSVGLMIAAYNEVDVLQRTLSAVLAQHAMPNQIVIVDDGSNDGSAQLITKLYGCEPADYSQLSVSPLYPNLAWLRLPHGGKARALNQALGHMHTDIIITVDADTLLAPDALQAMRQAFATEPNLVAATGVLSPVCQRDWSGKILQWFQTYEYIRNFISRFAWMRQDSLLLISGAFAGFRRQALLQVGGFDAQCLVEDYELIHRLRRYAVEHGLAWQVRVLGEAQARTSAPSTIPAFLMQRRRWFAGFLQTQYWNLDMVGNARFGMLGMLMLPVKMVDTLQPIYGLLAFALLLLFVASRQLSLLAVVLMVIGAKIVIDLLFHIWSVYLYYRWTGQAAQSKFLWAILAALLEPFSFQLLRHTGAVMGWYYFLTGRQKWGKQRRHQI
jgi:cellulose synthase/poly-beta-1,6-N-acetylglucosamine synthase-like glycosyltransferase